MKNILISRICYLTIICFVGLSPIAYLRAQQAVAVTPEVKADLKQRLAADKNMEIPQSLAPNKLWRQRCNSKGGNLSDGITPEDACNSIAVDELLGKEPANIEGYAVWVQSLCRRSYLQPLLSLI
jgi:hypothetical protein